MRTKYLRLVMVGLGLIMAQFSSAQNPAAASSPASSGRGLTQLFNRIWRVERAPSTPAAGSIYVFLANGTLLETSCTETYRIATWTVDKNKPMQLRIVEDGQLAFTAKIKELTNSTLKIEKRLSHGNEKQDVTFKSVEKEFVCPDLR